MLGVDGAVVFILFGDILVEMFYSLEVESV